MDKPTDWYSGTRLAVAEGHTKMKAIRCLKRYISCEVYSKQQVNSIPIAS
ncbi:hypothetical protein ECP029943810_4993 [Escherichia coli P0299438.10]|nr:hypothetical protein EC2726800_5407 [Escherichia coli 2726800]ENB83756.1 hypothetical protein ECP029943810_4993 [Escherichia coli P0299438.10]WNT90910.1 hypothetical protein QMY53_04952 [Escherichia coli TW14425]